MPNLCVPLDSVIYMPHAVNVHPQRYLQVGTKNQSKFLPFLTVFLFSGLDLLNDTCYKSFVCLQALFLACKNLLKDFASLGYQGKEINLHKKSVNSLLDLDGNLPCSKFQVYTRIKFSLTQQYLIFHNSLNLMFYFNKTLMNMFIHFPVSCIRLLLIQLIFFLFPEIIS